MLNPFSHGESATIAEVFSLYGFTYKQEQSAWSAITKRWHETSGRFYAYAIAHEIAANHTKESDPMVQEMFGFTKRASMTEHDFAKFLRRHGAIDNWQKVGNSNQWADSSGKVVAVAVYTGRGGMTVTYWTASDLPVGR